MLPDRPRIAPMRRHFPALAPFNGVDGNRELLWDVAGKTKQRTGNSEAFQASQAMLTLAAVTHRKNIPKYCLPAGVAGGEQGRFDGPLRCGAALQL